MRIPTYFMNDVKFVSLRSDIYSLFASAILCAIWYCSPPIQYNTLTHLPIDKMAAISQAIFSFAFSRLESSVFGFKINWSLFLRIHILANHAICSIACITKQVCCFFAQVNISSALMMSWHGNGFRIIIISEGNPLMTHQCPPPPPKGQ